MNTSPLRWEIAAVSERGRRDENQDNYLLIDGQGQCQTLHDQALRSSWLPGWPAGHQRLAVADGMGGHRHGRIASETLSTALLALPFQATTSSLRSALLALHTDLFERFYQGQETPGSTLTFADIAPDGSAVLAHIGDSRAYLWQGSDWRQCTLDHTPGEFAWRDREIGQAAYQHALRTANNRIAQAMIFGSSGIIAAADGGKANGHHAGLRLDAEDLCGVAVGAGDVLVLASDGLWAHRPDNQIDWPSPTGNALQPWLQTQVHAALVGGSTDNLTAIALRCIG